MKTHHEWLLAGALLLSISGVVSEARGEDAQCMYHGQFFSPGAVSCQDGAQYRCVAGSWQATGLDCADTGADADQEGPMVDPSRRAPTVQEPGVRRPSPPTVPQN